MITASEKVGEDDQWGGVYAEARDVNKETS